ncbi:MAG: hypothetical protein PHF67_04945 [Candidatus Nanoarchaeia archaeon]|nr:hypothetical protein [Candidatus Nanoarchaeia archaeon]
MAEQEVFQQDPMAGFFAEIGTRLNEIEEKQRLLKDRVLLIGENLISTKEEMEKQNLEFKKQIKQMDFELKSLKQLNKRVIEELDNFARKTELEILERQFKMFQPLEFARIKDIKDIINKEMKKQG